MTKALVLLGGVLFFKVALPRRGPTARHRPYASAFDVRVPDSISCSLLCDPQLVAAATPTPPTTATVRAAGADSERAMLRA